MIISSWSKTVYLNWNNHLMKDNLMISEAEALISSLSDYLPVFYIPIESGADQIIESSPRAPSDWLYNYAC